TGDWAYQSAETFSALLLLVTVSAASVAARRRRSLLAAAAAKQKACAPAQEGASVGGCRYLFLAAIVCGLVLKHDINESFPEDFAWAFAMYMETLAFVPFIRHQLAAKRKTAKADGDLAEHDLRLLRQKRYTAKPVLARRLWRQFLFSLVVSRAVQLAFWAITFEEFAPGTGAAEEEDIQAGGNIVQSGRDGNIRGWFSLAATVAQLAFSLYLLKLYCETQRRLDKDYFEAQNDRSASGTGEEKTAPSVADYTKEPTCPAGPRKRFIAASACCGGTADGVIKKQGEATGRKQQC
ncbi:transmembrane protein, partial [Cystoisospora suis]